MGICITHKVCYFNHRYDFLEIPTFSKEIIRNREDVYDEALGRVRDEKAIGAPAHHLVEKSAFRSRNLSHKLARLLKHPRTISTTPLNMNGVDSQIRGKSSLSRIICYHLYIWNCLVSILFDLIVKISMIYYFK